MEPFRVVCAVAACLPRDDIDTDQILPTPYLRDPEADLAKGLFGYLRGTDCGFVLDQPAFAQAGILVTGRNFGCGSSREHAVWALKAFGIRCVIAESFAETFRENCLRNAILPIALPSDDIARLVACVEAVAGGEPFTIDLADTRIHLPGDGRIAFEMPEAERIALLEGLDDTGMTLRHADAIAAWERATRHSLPFLQAVPPMGVFWPTASEASGTAKKTP